MSRYKWTLAIILLSIIVTAGCASKSTTSEPNIPAARTPEQESSNTPARMDPPPTVVETIPSADGVASAFLNAWEGNDFLGMYSLLSPASQSMIDKQLFVERYQDAQDAATVVTVVANPVSILQDGQSAQTTFHLTWQTALFGDIERDMSLSLVYESSRWMVSWSDALILPELGGGNTLFLEYQIPVRANIYDRNGLGLAVEGKAVNVGVVPAEIVDEASLLLILEEILDLPIDEIREKYVTVDPTWYVPLGDAPAEAVALKLDALQPNIESGGIQLKERKTRLYREGGVAPHVLGYTGAISAEVLEYWDTLGYRGDERVGIAGVESWGESYLGGARGGTLYLNSPTGDRLGIVAETLAPSNRSLFTTVDRAFQQSVQQALDDAIESHEDGHAGAVVVMDVNSGEILAMASYPTYDPNLFDPINPDTAAGLAELLTDPTHPLVNRAAQGAYPPGSVFKIVTMSAGLLSGSFLPTTPYHCTGTWDGLGPNYIKGDWKEGGHGDINLSEALTQSCDPYFYTVGLTLEHVDSFMLPDTARAFGFGAPTGVAGIAEDGGIVPDPDWKFNVYGEGWGAGDGVNMAIGQGFVTATPLQVARMMGAIANGGTLYVPQIIQRIGEGTGVAEELVEAQVAGHLPINETQIQVIQDSLLAVTTQPGGTARHRFKDMLVPVAAKTGTSEVPPVFRADGTLNEEPTAWFAAYAPAAPTPGLPGIPDEPEIAIVAVIENAGEGSAVAAPIVRRIIELYYGLAPLTEYPW